MLRGTMAVVMACTFALSAHGQTDPPPTIDCVGTADISFEPDYVEFWLTFRASGDSLEQAVEKTLPFEKKLLDALDDSDFRGADVTMSGVGISDLLENRTIMSARVRFAVPRAVDAEERALEFASLCDEVKRIGGALESIAEGPFLGVNEAEAAEQDAIARATENALYKADAVAALMESNIYAVQTVSVLDVKWNDPGTPPTAVPDIVRITCKARVKVVYKYSPY